MALKTLDKDLTWKEAFDRKNCFCVHQVNESTGESSLKLSLLLSTGHRIPYHIQGILKAQSQKLVPVVAKANL